MRPLAQKSQHLQEPFFGQVPMTSFILEGALQSKRFPIDRGVHPLRDDKRVWWLRQVCKLYGDDSLSGYCKVENVLPPGIAGIKLGSPARAVQKMAVTQVDGFNMVACETTSPPQRTSGWRKTKDAGARRGCGS